VPGNIEAIESQNLPEDIVQQFEAGEELRAWYRTAGLSAGERSALEFHQEGYSGREVADLLGTTENSVNVQLSRARKKLRAHPR